jgi:zinc/manganese transport system permease protein
LLIAMRAGWLERIGRFGFYGAFALAVTASVQVVGVYLVFASLIFPALGVQNQDGSRRYRLALITGIAGYAFGLVLSALFDLPSGAVIVWTLAACALVCAGLRLVSNP